ncbi:MAG: lipoyl(octanoyl) transferase LipB [Candidatus Caldarchaeum sp.]
MSRNSIIFVDLGTIEYESCHKLMLELHQKRVENQIEDTVLLLEHYDVYTLGKRGREEDVFDRTIPVYRVERGGEATYHGPGQLVAYFIVSLQELGIGVADFVHLVEQAIIDVLADFQISGERVVGKPGVWVDGRKIASVGMAVKNWVTYHGVALNVNTDLKKFYGIKPCGMEATIMTSMASIIGRPVDINKVKKSMVKHVSKALNKEPEVVEKLNAVLTQPKSGI